ncbi:MAG: outer membrane protein assembly factor BamD [Bacteroidaceae bacterium]|nr:outer membrane protein assembly factor BamD [Bacteroidaceae bacterium]
MRMNVRIIIVMLSTAWVLASCTNINKAMKSTDLDFKYEMAKQYFTKGKYENACLLLGEVVNAYKGTERGDEAMFLYGMSKYLGSDLEEANEYLTKYYRSYPTGAHVEEARFYAGKALYETTPSVNLDQTDTYMAITEFQNFIETFPQSKYAEQCRKMIFEMQDKLVLKEYNSAKLYYSLGSYFGNCTMEGSGSNYEACILTSQNAIKDYPYSELKEEFAILILRARYELARQSVPSKQMARYESTIDEYYGFVNEYPNSKHKAEAEKIFSKSKAATKRSNNTNNDGLQKD